jgi:hypothetical protein
MGADAWRLRAVPPGLNFRCALEALNAAENPTSGCTGVRFTTRIWKNILQLNINSALQAIIIRRHEFARAISGF